jgi:hypothetical protein
MGGWLAHHAAFIACVAAALYRCGTDPVHGPCARRTLRFPCGSPLREEWQNDVLASATTATPIQSRTSFSASLGATKDARKIGKSLFPVHRKATVSSSAASKI